MNQPTELLALRDVLRADFLDGNRHPREDLLPEHNRRCHRFGLQVFHRKVQGKEIEATGLREWIDVSAFGLDVNMKFVSQNNHDVAGVCNSL